MQRRVDDEDAEVMFDRASLLPRQNTTQSRVTSKEFSRRCLLAAFFGLVRGLTLTSC